jgi:hypothetical protein
VRGLRDGWHLWVELGLARIARGVARGIEAGEHSDRTRRWTAPAEKGYVV